MNIIISAPGFKVSDTLDAYIREKVNKLTHHVNNIVRADVNLYIGPDSDPEKYHCEIRLEVPGNDHFAKKKCSTFELAIVDTVDALESIARKNRDKHISNRHATE